jgi:hypothetical protein
MRSINIYWSLGKTDRRRETLRPLRHRAVRNRFTAVECMAASAGMAMASRLPCGAYLLGPDALGRIACGELKPKMYGKDLVTENGGRGCVSFRCSS